MAKLRTTDRPADRILTFSEIARRIGKSPSTVRRWAHEGLLPAVRQPSGLLGVTENTYRKFFSYLDSLEQKDG